MKLGENSKFRSRIEPVFSQNYKSFRSLNEVRVTYFVWAIETPYLKAVSLPMPSASTGKYDSLSNKPFDYLWTVRYVHHMTMEHSLA